MCHGVRVGARKVQRGLLFKNGNLSFECSWLAFVLEKRGKEGEVTRWLHLGAVVECLGAEALIATRQW